MMQGVSYKSEYNSAVQRILTYEAWSSINTDTKILEIFGHVHSSTFLMSENQ